MKALLALMLTIAATQAFACDEAWRYKRNEHGELIDTCRDRYGVDRCEHTDRGNHDRDWHKH